MSWLRHWHLWDSNKALIHSWPGSGPRSRQLSQLPRLGSVCTLHLYIPLNIDPCAPSGNRTRPYTKIKSNLFLQKFEFLKFFSESCSLPLGHPESATKIFIGLKLFAVQASASPESNPSLYQNQLNIFWVFEGFIYDMNPGKSKACQLKH